MIVDERGIVCSRYEVLSNGCCTVEQKQASENKDTSSIVKRKRYSCETCNPLGCCTIYEYCVSCCLDPDKVDTYRFYNLLLRVYSYVYENIKDYSCSFNAQDKKSTILKSLNL